jgi:hypothetical protein
MYDNNRPDRAEFFYPKCGCFMTPDAKGPPLMEKSGNYQELSSYLEYAPTNRWSVFTNIPVRFLNPEVNANAQGLGDVSFGTKYAFVYNPNRIITFTSNLTTPTGAFASGLGTHNWWLAPGLLYLEQLSPRWQVFGELIDNIPLTRSSDFTGNVLQYGVGTSYIVAQSCRGYVAPVVECVGWTILSGKEATDTGAVLDARGDTIVNAKFGVRIGIGQTTLGEPYPTRSDLYLGYGRALTGAVWYKDMFRLEYRMRF